MVVAITDMVDALETLSCSYWIAVRRVRRMAVSEQHKLAVRADVEATYRGGEGGDLPQIGL